jgi:hypothetical protein
MDNKFNLERAIAGDPIETVAETPAEFIAYRPTLQDSQRLIVQMRDQVRLYYSNGTLYSGNTPAEPSESDLRMKSVEKQIDRTKLPVDTWLITPNGDKQYTNNGMRSNFPAWKNPNCFEWVDGTTIAPDQAWIVWHGGDCPIPDGLEYEVIVRYGECFIPTNIGCKLQHIWVRSKYPHQTHLGHEVIAYRLTGRVLSGWKL